MSSLGLPSIAIGLLLPFLVFAGVVWIACKVMEYQSRRTLVNSCTVLRSLSSRPSSILSWKSNWTNALVRWTFCTSMVALAVFVVLPWLDHNLVEIDKQNNLVAIEHLLRDPEVRENINNWLDECECSDSSEGKQSFRLDIIEAISLPGLTDAGVTEPDWSLPFDAEEPSDQFKIWLENKADLKIATIRGEILDRLVASISLNPSKSYMPLSPHQNRSVFSVRDRLEDTDDQFKFVPETESPAKQPDDSFTWKRDKWFVLSLLFATSKEVRKVADPTAASSDSQTPPDDSQTSADDQALKKKLALTPAHFDGMRTRLLEHTYSWTGYVRSVYAGWPNVLIVVVAIGLFGLQYSRHLQFHIRDELQTPPAIKLADTKEFGSELPIEQWLVLQLPRVTDKGKVFLWKYRDIPQFSDRIHKHIVDGRVSPVLEQLDITVSDLEAAIPHWTGVTLIGVQESAKKIIAEKSEQVAEKWISLAPSASASAKRHVELLTELGFIGTVIGIIAGMADAALTQVPSEDPLFRSTATGQMLSSLSIAFSTTLIGLLCAMVLGWIYANWEQREKQGILDATTQLRTHLEVNYVASIIDRYK